MGHVLWDNSLLGANKPVYPTDGVHTLVLIMPSVPLGECEKEIGRKRHTGEYQSSLAQRGDEGKKTEVCGNLVLDVFADRSTDSQWAPSSLQSLHDKPFQFANNLPAVNKIASAIIMTVTATTTGA